MRVGEHYCPGVLHAVQAKDGLLVRIRVPGGLIEPDQFRSVADLSRSFADGSIEITSRANLQLRAIRDQDLSQVIDGISLAGLLPSPQHDRVRNIVSSPLAGLDPDELIDPRPLVRELDRRLQADPALINLHPKFSIAIHGGPNRFSRDFDDISLDAVNVGDTRYFCSTLGGVPLGFAVMPGEAVDCTLALARMCIELAQEFSVPVRGKAVVAIPAARERILAALSDGLSHRLEPSPLSLPATIINEALLGLCATSQDGRVSISPSIPLGRLNPEQAHYLSDTCKEWQGDLRLAPWRGVVLGSIPKSAAETIVAQLRALGLSCEGRDGFQGIAACAGITGCDASLADVRADAASLAHRLAGHAVPPGWTVNLSGCEKQCARRHGATAELVASPLGYTLTIKERGLASDCSRESALDAVAALHQSMLPEVVAR